MPVTVSAPEVWPMASTAGRARRTASASLGDGGVDQGDDRAGGVAVGGRVEQGGRDRGGGAEPGAHGIRERLAGAERVGHEQRAGERVVPRGRQPRPAPHQPGHGRAPVAVGAQVVALATTSALTARRAEEQTARMPSREPPARRPAPVAPPRAAQRGIRQLGAEVVCPGDRSARTARAAAAARRTRAGRQVRAATTSSARQRHPAPPTSTTSPGATPHGTAPDAHGEADGGRERRRHPR